VNEFPKKGVAGICLHDFGFLIEKERKKKQTDVAGVKNGRNKKVCGYF
jgi:hypothetical protein